MCRTDEITYDCGCVVRVLGSIYTHKENANRLKGLPDQTRSVKKSQNRLKFKCKQQTYTAFVRALSVNYGPFQTRADEEAAEAARMRAEEVAQEASRYEPPREEYYNLVGELGNRYGYY
jgi:hypothetical protein